MSRSKSNDNHIIYLVTAFDNILWQQVQNKCHLSLTNIWQGYKNVLPQLIWKHLKEKHLLWWTFWGVWGELLYKLQAIFVESSVALFEWLRTLSIGALSTFQVDGWMEASRFTFRAGHNVIIQSVLSRHHPYKLWKKEGRTMRHNSRQVVLLLVTTVREDNRNLPSKSTSPSPFRSTSLRMSSKSLGHTCGKKLHGNQTFWKLFDNFPPKWKNITGSQSQIMHFVV